MYNLLYAQKVLPIFMSWVYYENRPGLLGHSVCQTKLPKYTNPNPELKWLHLRANKILICGRKFKFSLSLILKPNTGYCRDGSGCPSYSVQFFCIQYKNWTQVYKSSSILFCGDKKKLLLLRYKVFRCLFVVCNWYILVFRCCILYENEIFCILMAVLWMELRYSCNQCSYFVR